MPPLERRLGLARTTLMGLGVILGAGIYALVGKATAIAGSAVWMSFGIAAAVAAVTGLSYAELSASIPRAAGEYHYVRRAFGPVVGFLTAWMLLAGITVASAAVALAFGGYLSPWVSTGPEVPAIGLIAACGVLLWWGVEASATLAAASTVLAVAGLLGILAIGLPSVGSVDLLAMPQGFSGVLSAATLVFFAFLGFQQVVELAEEVEAPARTLPRALMLSVGISTALYMLVAVASVGVLGSQALGDSEAPLAAVAEAQLGWAGGALLSGIALVSTANTVLVLLMSSSRMLYGIAEAHALPSWLAIVGRRATPWVATLAVAGVAVVGVGVFRSIDRVANLTNASLIVTFVMIHLSVVVLRYREPDLERPFRVPVAVAGVPVLPLLGAVAAAAMLGGVGLEVLPVALGVLSVGAIVAATSRGRAG